MGSPASSHSSSPGSPSRASQGLLPHDPAPVESYALELISEFLTREKRDYMLKNKWVKMGRDQLGKDLADIEMSLCVIGKSYPGPNAPSLMPVFLQVRRTFALPASPLPAKVLEPFYGMLPSQPDPDSIPLREPSVSSTTASLYVNPRLPDVEALDLIEELLENEREKGINADVSQEKTIAWLDGLVDQMVKRVSHASPSLLTYSSPTAPTRQSLTRRGTLRHTPAFGQTPPTRAPSPSTRWCPRAVEATWAIAAPSRPPFLLHPTSKAFLDSARARSLVAADTSVQ